MDIKSLNDVAKNLKGFNGCFMIGKIDGVDFTVSGSITDEKTGRVNNFGSSVKLKFTQSKQIVKKVNGFDLTTTKLVTNIIKVPCTDSELISKVNKFNSLINKEVLISLELADNSTFVTNEVFEVN